MGRTCGLCNFADGLWLLIAEEKGFSKADQEAALVKPAMSKTIAIGGRMASSEDGEEPPFRFLLKERNGLVLVWC